MKTLTPERNRPAKQGASSSIVPQTWEDFCRVYPIYEALASQCGLTSGPYPTGTASDQWPQKQARDLLWLDQVDRQVLAVHLRHLLATPAAAREDGLRVLVQRHLRKREKLPSDRDKVDLLIVQYFVLCAPQSLIAGRVETSDVAKILRPILGDVEAASPEFGKSLERVLEASQQCASLRDFMEQGLLEQGRIVKEAAGSSFYDPAALVAICRFNFLLRRAFIHLLHADLRAIDAALKELERRRVRVVDCRRAGLSAAESIDSLRHIHRHWKPPFQSDYAQGAAFRPYDQLMSLRDDLEEALAGSATSAPSAPTVETKRVAPRDDSAKADTPRKIKAPGGSIPPATPVAPSAKPQKEPASAGQRPARSDANLREEPSTTEQKTSGSGPLDVETLEEQIWEQLIATPPARGRSMTTVTVENTRILLSAWEVAAFVSNSGQDSDELRRVIVARAMLAAAIDRRKHSMDFKVLQQALTHARGEIPHFQERVEQFKRSLKMDGAVNLGISLKRLVSLIDGAEQLQKGNDT